MSAIALRFRGVLIGIFSLLLSAGVVFAGGGFALPDAATGGLERAAEAAAQADGDEDGDGDTDAPAVEDGEDGDGDTDAPVVEDGDEDADNHGDLVSEAAQMETPEGFTNHGAFVSCVARMLYLDPEADSADEVVLAELTPEDCERDDADTDDADTDDADADDTDADEDADNHGDLVSEAAQMETPDGFTNHGAFVSCVARMNYGHTRGEEPAEPVVLADLTSESCAQAEATGRATADDGPGKSGEAKAKAKGAGKGPGKAPGKGPGRDR